MKRLATILLALILLAVIPGGCGKKEETMTLYTWEGMFPPEVLEGFTKETGIQINYTNFDTDENMLARLEAAKGGDYDVVIADDYIIETVIAEGLAQKLDTGKLQNWGNINPVFQGQFFDPANEYTVPYGSGVQTIVYNPKTVSKEIRGYADLWDESLTDNVAVIGNYRVVNGMALKVMGESYNTEDPAVIAQAGKSCWSWRPTSVLLKTTTCRTTCSAGRLGLR